MNEKIDALSRGVAVQAIAKKIADGDLDASTISFEDAVSTLKAAILDMVKNYGVLPYSTTKPKKAPRKAAEPKAATGARRGGVEPEALRGYLSQPVGGVSNPSTLQEIADNFKVSKGVAQRAVEALGSAVKSGTGTKPDGQRGKAPTVFWAE